jgi:hypothetical protein
MWSRYGVVFLLAFALTGCSAGGGIQTAYIAGTWRGSWNSQTYPGAGGQFIMTVTQSGSTFSGTAQMTNSCFGMLQISGSVAGSNFIATLSSGGRDRVSASGSVAGNTMTGTYRTLDLTGTNCPVDQGSFSGVRS